MSLDNVYDFSDLAPLDTKNDPVEYRKFYDQASGFTANNAPVQNHFTFRISDINSLWLLHRAYLQVQFDVDNGGSNERATFANGLGHLFERVILRLGDTIIEDKPRHAFRDYEVDSMTWSKQYAETVGSMMLYHPEDLGSSKWAGINKSRAVHYVPGGTTATITPDAFDVAMTPESYNRTLTDQNPSYAMIPLYHLFNFPKVYQKVIRGMDVEIELYTTGDNVRLIRSAVQSNGLAAGTSPGAADVALKWSGAGITLHIPRIKPNAREEGMFNAQLAKGFNVPVEFEKSIVYRENIPTGRADGEWSVTTNTSTPTRLYLFLTEQTSETSQLVGARQRNLLLQRLDVYINGEKTPTEQLEAEGAGGSSILQRNFTQYMRMWQNAQNNFDGVYDGAAGGSHMNHLTFDLNNVIAIDLKQTDKPLIDKSSDIRVSYRFDAAAPTAHWLYGVLFSKSRVDLEMSEGRSQALVR